MQIKGREFDTVINKFGFASRDSGDRLAWLEIDGRVVVRTKRSLGKGDMPCADLIRQQLKLNENQLRLAIACTFSRDDYISHLRAKRVV